MWAYGCEVKGLNETLGQISIRGCISHLQDVIISIHHQKMCATLWCLVSVRPVVLAVRPLLGVPATGAESRPDLRFPGSRVLAST